jgi:CheY-like chemotaxis protein
MEAVGQLTAGLAHDFNNLLQVIEGNLEMLAQRASDPSLSRLVERARAASDRGAKLTRQLLAFARKTRLESRPVQLSDLVHDFSPLIETTIGRSIDLQLNLRRRLPNVVIDPDQFEMALLNVVANARDAMPDGGLLTITTSTMHLNGDAAARELPPGDYALVEIEDEGDGMPDHVLQRAMEPFFTTKGVGKGTGLGLAMASGFAQQSRGRLELQNRPTKGLVARFLFPVSREAGGIKTTEEASRPRRTDAVGASILVVDDQAEIVQLAEEILTAAGYEVVTAQDSADALALLSTRPRPFDLLFTDILMPGGLNGLQLAEQAQAVSPGLPILFTTGYTEDLVPEGADHRGLDVIGKPYRRSELLDRIAEALAKKASAGPRRKASDFGAAES